MTNDQLNRLFESARNIPLETAPEDVATWVGTAAATSTGVLGLAGKLKLFIAKKTLIIMGTTLSIVSLSIITALSLRTDAPAEKTFKSPNRKVATAQLNAPKSTPEEITSIDTNRRMVEAAPTPPKAPPPPEPPAPLLVPFRGPLPVPPVAPTPPVAPAPARSGVQSAPTAPTSSATYANRKKVKPTGKVVKKEFEVTDFTKLDISGVMDVVLIQGSSPKVVFEADECYQSLFTAANKGETLLIDMNGECEGKKCGNSTVFITLTDINQFDFSGVGDVKSEGEIKLNALECSISGVGDLNLKMNCENLELSFTGVGDITLSGTGNKATYQWSGVGDLMANDLVSRDVSLNLSGVGDADVNATEKLEVKLMGLGDVHYKGSPKATNLNTTGMGDIKGS